MLLLIVRHAWAGQRGDPAWPDDSKRPLTDEGKKRFARMVDLLAERGANPKLIATSPLVRCVQTAEILADALDGLPEVTLRDELEPEGPLRPLLRWTTQQAPQFDEIAWVGHAPDVGEYASALIGGGTIRFAKGSVAAIRFDGAPEIGGGDLRWLVTAKMLGC